MKIMRGTFAPPADHYSTELKDLILNLLQLDPDFRPNANQIMAKPIVINTLLQLLDFGSLNCKRFVDRIQMFYVQMLYSDIVYLLLIYYYLLYYILVLRRKSMFGSERNNLRSNHTNRMIAANLYYSESFYHNKALFPL